MKHKTEGLEYVKHSLGSFNGSGYADMSSAQAYLESYRDYNHFYKRKEQAELTDRYWQYLLPIAEHIVRTSHGAGRRPSQKSLDRFADFRKNGRPAKPENSSLF